MSNVRRVEKDVVRRCGRGTEPESRGVAALRFGMSDGGTRDWRLGWRLASAVRSNPGFEVNLDVTRREPVNDDPSLPT